MLKNLVYFGSPEFSSQILETIILSKQVNVVGVVTTPDKPQGRQQILTPSPVALLGEKYNLPVYKPLKLDDANLAHLKLLKPDIFLFVSFGKIVLQSWLNTPTIGTFNIHFSLLPKYRGALCISEAIKNQDSETGVTLMVMDSLLDHGPIIDRQKVTIEIDDDVATLTTKLTQAAVKILRDKLPEICAQNYPSTPQDESRVVFTPSHKTLTHASALIPWETIQLALSSENSKLSSSVHALIRSQNPEPGAWTEITTSPVGAHRDAPETAIPTPSLREGTPTKQSIQIKILKTSLISTKLTIEQVQMPGKQPITWKQFLAGHSEPLSRQHAGISYK